MRIRRNASKILGSASLAYAANPNCPATPVTAAGAEAEDFTVCELNCSPWDLMATDPNSPYRDFLVTNLKGEEEEEEEEGDLDEGILGNAIETDEPEPITSTAAELTLREMKEIEEKKLVKRRRISKGKEKEAAPTAYCKKTDGKGWHCKRQAQLPNSLCSYHLAQIKAYSSSHRALPDSASTVADSGKCSGGNHRKRKAAGEEATDRDSGFYYYYEGFGPWRGKRRGRPVSAGSSATARNSCGGNAKVKEDSSSKESTILDNGGDDDDDNDDAVAGDDEYGLDHFKELDDHHGDHATHCKEREDANVVAKKEGSEKKRVAKKRGRKPFKCRSLKSLL